MPSDETDQICDENDARRQNESRDAFRLTVGLQILLGVSSEHVGTVLLSLVAERLNVKINNIDDRTLHTHAQLAYLTYHAKGPKPLRFHDLYQHIFENKEPTISDHEYMRWVLVAEMLDSANRMRHG
jgi:hypothetical protein